MKPSTLAPKPQPKRTRGRAQIWEEEPATYSVDLQSFTDDESETLAKAEAILAARFTREGYVTGGRSAGDFLRMRLAHLQREEFHAVWLDNHHRVIATECLSTGTINTASVHPREVVRAALQHNAAAVLFAHNHPSGDSTPSPADRAITLRLRDALNLVDVRTLDHFVIGSAVPVSGAALGWLA